MASKELSILLLAKDMASKTIGKVSKEIGGLGKMGRTAGAGLRSLGANLAKVGALAAVGIGAAVKGGLENLATLESAVTSVDGAIKQMGLTGKATGGQVATWANEIEANIGAAFDDKAIVSATATLIRFGKVTAGNLRPAMQIIADLATKTGSVESAATLLAKALADPEKAAGKLARSGVVLTKVQIAEVKALMKVGKAAEAQKVILDALAKTTKGAALASQGPYKRAMSVLADVTEDAQKALAEGFLPVLEKVAGKLSTALANPKVMAGIREFGQTLAGALDSALAIAEKLPWETIGNSLKIAGAGAKALLGAFVALPPWVQTAVITGWGLNKLTGGALGSIVGQLGSGLIKGVLGLNAGVVNAKAGVVNVIGGAGVPGGGAPGAVATAGAAGIAGIVIAAASIIGIGAAVGNVMFRFIPELVNAGKPVTTGERNPFTGEWTGTGPPGTPKPRVAGGGEWGPRGRGDAGTAARVAEQSARAGVWERATAAGMKPTAASIERTMAKNAERTAAAAARTEAATRAASMLAQFAAVRAIAAQVMGTAAIVTAIHGIAAPKVSVNLTVRDQLVAQKKWSSYGAPKVTG